MPGTISQVARTPLHHWHQARGARFVDRDGWQVVASYAGAEAEAAAARAGLGLADVSSFAKVGARGPGAGPSLPRLDESNNGTPPQTDVTCDYAGFELVGQALDAVLCRLTHLDVRPAALPPGSCAATALAGVEALLVRLDRGALPALRVYVAWDLGEYVWERIIEAGRGVPVTPIGVEALALLC